MTDKPYTDADVEVAARAEFDADQRRLIATSSNPAAFEPTPWSLPTLSHIRDTYRERTRAGLDALAAAGRLAPPGDDLTSRLAAALTDAAGLGNCRQVPHENRVIRWELLLTEYTQRAGAVAARSGCDQCAGLGWVRIAGMVTGAVCGFETITECQACNPDGRIPWAGQVEFHDEQPHHLAHQTAPGVFDPNCPACKETTP